MLFLLYFYSTNFLIWPCVVDNKYDIFGRHVDHSEEHCHSGVDPFAGVWKSIFVVIWSRRSLFLLEKYPFSNIIHWSTFQETWSKLSNVAWRGIENWKKFETHVDSMKSVYLIGQSRRCSPLQVVQSLLVWEIVFENRPVTVCHFFIAKSPLRRTPLRHIRQLCH